jgi:hypothetical protein
MCVVSAAALCGRRRRRSSLNVSGKKNNYADSIFFYIFALG